MREVLDELLDWWRSGQPVGMATVVATFNSAPRAPGASMLVGPEGQVVGSVSGGCVEAAVYELAQQVIADGTPVLQRYGVSDESAFEVGLTCGGTLDVYVQKVDRDTFPELELVADDIANGRPVAVISLVGSAREQRGRLVLRGGDQVLGSLGGARLDAAVADDAKGLLAAGQSSLLTYGPEGQRRGVGTRAFVWAFSPPPRMVVFGAIDFAAAVATVGSFLGYRVTVCDARPVFATHARFPAADEVMVEWPHRYLRKEADAGRIDERTVVCVLTHDPKFDVPLLEQALDLPRVAYIGVMGSRRTHADRLQRLRSAGIPEEKLAVLSSPIGLDLGARTPEETAVSIAAEIVAMRWGGGGERLSLTRGRIHHD